MAEEFDLPVVIIQHIQHYLDGKQSAQTVVLSKSWHAAWLTRSTLYFNENCFNPDNFSSFAEKTVTRYKDAKLHVHKLVLIMNNTDCFNKNKNCTNLRDELITDTLKMGAYEFVIALEPKGSYSTNRYVLPTQLFDSTCVTKLDVSGCQINNGRVLFTRLESLLLDRVYVKDETIGEILLGCPLIERLGLVSCEGLYKVNLSKMRSLVELRVCGWVDVEFGDAEFGVDVAEFRYLRTLWFEKVKLGKEFFTGFAVRFPRVKMLHLEGVPCEDLEISSCSLRYLRLIHCKETKTKMVFDVPNIVWFVYKGGYDIPSVSFGSTVSKDWASYVQFAFSHDVIEDSWFVELRKLLTELSQSRISLHIKLCGKCEVSAERFPCFPIPVVEELSVDASQVSHTSPSAWRCLFWSCRPNFITECKPSAWWERGHDPFILTDLYQLLRRDDSKDNEYNSEDYELSRGDENKDLFYRMYKLEEVNLEVFDEDLVEWQSIPLETLVDILKKDGDENMRFRFTWGEEYND